MTVKSYPNLGWNPVPGIPSEVHALKTKVDSAAKALRRSHQQIERLLGESSHWEGDAASAFREELDGDLPTFMKNAARSLEKAAAQLAKWEDNLASNHELAKKYDDEAKEKKAAVGTAKERQQHASKDPDLKLGGKEFPSQAEADAATDRLRAAERRLKEASESLESANDAYDSVISKARALEKEHEREANRVADQLDQADDKLAPKEPGWLSKTLDAIGEGLKAAGEFLLEHAGTIGAIAGLLALIPTPLSPILAGVAVAASGIALANDVSQNWEALSNPGWNMDTFSAYASVVGDAAGMVPGLGALGKASTETIFASKLAAESGGVLSAGTKASTFVSETTTAFTTGATSAATEAKALDYGLGGLNVAANGVSELEAAEVLPEDGAGHNTNESVKAGMAAKDGVTGAREISSVVGDLAAAIKL